MDNYEKYQRIFMEIFGMYKPSDLTSDFTFEKSDLWIHESYGSYIKIRGTI